MKNYKSRPQQKSWWVVVGNEGCGLYDSEILARQAASFVAGGKYHKFNNRTAAKKYLAERLFMITGSY